MNYYNEISNYYDQDAKDFDARYWENPVLQQIRQSFREEVKRFHARSMLEIGCGTGLDIVHFANTHPEVKIYGIDISNEMVKLARERIKKNSCENAVVERGSVEDIGPLFHNKHFDLIYVFFGALNTVDNLQIAADHLKEALNPNGIMVLSFVNKWYLAGMIIEILKLNFKGAFARLKRVWGGYSPVKHLPSHCYTPGQIKKVFKDMNLLKCKGYSIVHPAWYYTRINKKLHRFSKMLWQADILLNKTFFRRFGEYSLFVFQNSNGLKQH
jgi:ubiquinone/menaquinone biosynthesis C-methylase UbiE